MNNPDPHPGHTRGCVILMVLFAVACLVLPVFLQWLWKTNGG